ncbi:mechanosensitive ion channel domain-containing protein [Thermodesulfovibrio sp.]|jgi:small-conductance mechanosensitive channel|uniref:mechanosensitive ion channel family protein n=1 Tax=Thermodesulfovibrio TaxID=28261 RepID=UPI0026167321|nr:mechanosensitive ion channel domain-containing protein [Thermodesulfovibrio sp.]
MNLEKSLIVIITAAVASALLLLIRTILFSLLHRWAKKTKNQIDDLIISTIKFPSFLLCLGIGLYIGFETSELPFKYNAYLIKVIHVIIILSATAALANLITRLFMSYVENKAISVQSTGLLNTIIKVSTYLIGIIIILHLLGISIAPLITALGIGGLAIGLALKDTLENLFAGIHIMTEKTIRIGDFIKLENGQEGFVDDISWRTTRIRMLPNNMIIIPNSKLAQSIVLNYSLPDKRMSLQLPVSVSYSSDPDRIMSIIVEEAQMAAAEIPGLLNDPPPTVRFIPGFGDNSLDFTLICHINEITDQYAVQSELRKRIFKRFKDEGIDIPFPQRVVWLKKAE